MLLRTGHLLISLRGRGFFLLDDRRTRWKENQNLNIYSNNCCDFSCFFMLFQNILYHLYHFFLLIIRWKWMPTLNCRPPVRPASWTRWDNRTRRARMATSKRPSAFTARPSRWIRAITSFSPTGRRPLSNSDTLPARFKTPPGPLNSTPNGQK